MSAHSAQENLFLYREYSHLDKCMLLTVTLKKHPIPSEYHLHNHKLATVTKAKYLGVHIVL